MAQQFYKIVDKNGNEMPGHYSGRNRTYEEAKKMVDNLNKNGEHRPYTMTGTQQTAVEWLAEQLKKQGFLYDLDIEAAKQMEKEQIIDAFDMGTIDDNMIGNEYYKDKYERTAGTE